MNGPVHKTRMGQKTQKMISSGDWGGGVRGLNFGLSLSLLPYFMYASCQGSGRQTVHIGRLL